MCWFQAKSVALELKDLQFDYVISSPFLRCLQTSAQILSQLDLTLDHFIIDCQLGEVMYQHLTTHLMKQSVR